ncbi:hypothetical protein BHYA_0015g00520 [Botrytis hyacinthi]|uniref:Uncharacterized protein n=1 Tax=Botrytis hyacinthi TaxID=278943 RepID=A0A4Z1H121_9HELO|nr:hypothetical protein BHYA_0015g00520 [Botrytis hyacinthi]
MTSISRHSFQQDNRYDPSLRSSHERFSLFIALDGPADACCLAPMSLIATSFAVSAPPRCTSISPFALAIAFAVSSRKSVMTFASNAAEAAATSNVIMFDVANYCF